MKVCILFVLQYLLIPTDSMKFNVSINKNQDGASEYCKDLVLYVDSINKLDRLYKVKVDTDFISLDLTFKSLEPVTNFIFDWNSMCLGYGHVEKIKPTSNFNKMTKKLKYSQIIIQNENNDFRFFYEGKLKDKHIYNVFMLKMCISDIDTFDINKEITLTTPEFLRENLKIRDNDKKIRLHYFYIPPKGSVVNGKDRIVFTSNWIDINE